MEPVHFTTRFRIFQLRVMATAISFVAVIHQWVLDSFGISAKNAAYPSYLREGDAFATKQDENGVKLIYIIDNFEVA